MRSRLRDQAPALILALCAGIAVAVAAVAEQTAWPLAPAFPWLHAGDFAYVAVGGEDAARTARAIAWVASVLAVALLVAAGVAAFRRHTRQWR